MSSPLSARADGAQPLDAPPATADSTAAGNPERAVVVFVGSSSASATLAPLLIELLGRANVQLTFATEPNFDAARLLSGGAEDRAVYVFVELVGDHGARLYFRGPQARRFLLRELDLHEGLDDLGREVVGQVIESSVTALLHSSAGLSRDEARAALSQRGGVALDTAPHEAPTPAAPPAPRRPPSFGAWLGLRYAAAWQGLELGIADGPGGEIGLEYRGRARLRTTLAVERSFSQAVDTADVTATIQRWPLRLSIGAGGPASGAHTWLVTIGAGADVIRVKPGLGLDAAVTPAAGSTHLVPVVRAALRYEQGGEQWRIALEIFADAFVFDTHYDLQVAGGSTERIATPWPVEPGVALVVAWCPPLAL